MDATDIPALIKSPQSCSEAEIEDFIAFVLAGAEVSSDGLKERVCSSEMLAFYREDTCLLGIAGLKRPSDHHRGEVSAGAKIQLPAKKFPFELGWVFVLPSARGKRISPKLCKPLVEAAKGQGIFSTSRKENEYMHKTLYRLEFSLAGQPYESIRGDYELQVFLRSPVLG